MYGYTYWDDTIVALATAPGLSAIGVVRLSGSRAKDIVDGMFPLKDLLVQAANTLHVRYLMDAEMTNEAQLDCLFCKCCIAKYVFPEGLLHPRYLQDVLENFLNPPSTR